MTTATGNVFLDDLISEVGNQTLQRFGLNIFNLNTYNAYNASVEGSINIFDTYDKKKNNEKGYHGHAFEELEATAHNIHNSLHNINQKNITTDRDKNSKSNDTVTDRVTYKTDSNRDIIDNIPPVSRYQDKAVESTKALMKERYLENDHMTVPADDYDKKKASLEKKIITSKTPEEKILAEQTLSRLQKGNFTREEAKNPRFTAVKLQAEQAANHIGQTALSDGINTALSTLASGFIAEVRLYYSGKSSDSLWEHLSRLIKKTFAQFKEGMKRGGSFAGIDIIISTVSSIFKGVFSSIKNIWDALRNSFKSIYNGIYDYVTGKIKTKAELFSVILKSLSSAIAVFGIALFETKLKVYVGDILATAISIIIGSFVVVSIPKIIDWFMGKFQATKLAKMRADEIAKLCDEELPKIITQREYLESEMNIYYNNHYARLNTAFSNLNIAIESNNSELTLSSLKSITQEYGVKSDLMSFDEFDDLMLSDKPLRF